MRLTIESPTLYRPLSSPEITSRRVRREVNGELIEARWTIVNGIVKPESVQAYPVDKARDGNHGFLEVIER